MARIDLRSVVKNFDSASGTVTALKDVNLTIADKEFVTLVGASGVASRLIQPSRRF